MQKRYKNFVINNKFYAHKKLERNDKYCGERFLDFIKKSGTSKKYYSADILKEFDKHYSKKLS